MIDKLKQPSTWSGIVAILLAVTLITEVQADLLNQFVAWVFAGIGIIRGLYDAFRDEPVEDGS